MTFSRPSGEVGLTHQLSPVIPYTYFIMSSFSHLTILFSLLSSSLFSLSFLFSFSFFFLFDLRPFDGKQFFSRLGCLLQIFNYLSPWSSLENNPPRYHVMFYPFIRLVPKYILWRSLFFFSFAIFFPFWSWRDVLFWGV